MIIITHDNRCSFNTKALLQLAMPVIPVRPNASEESNRDDADVKGWLKVCQV